MKLQRHGIAHRVMVLAVLAEEGTTATLVDVGLMHCDNGIDGGCEIRTQAYVVADAEGREEVS